MIEDVANYIHLELLVIIPTLYFLGKGIRSKWPQEKNSIPLILMFVGIFLATLWVMGANPISMRSLFTAITQGIVCAGMSVFGHELTKRASR